MNATSDSQFMVSFRSEHLTTTGIWCSQNQRRFVLADNDKQASDYVLSELAIWDGAFHKWSNLRSEHVPQAAEYTLGYFRFSKDIRIANT